MKNIVKPEENNETIEEKYTGTTSEHALRCPQCGSKSISVVGRCITCFNCGWSACNV